MGISFNPLTGNFDLTGAGGGATTIGTIDSASKSANGAVITGVTLILQTADATYPGAVSVSAQTLAGVKTFSSAIYAAAGLDVAATGGTDTLTIGGTNADVINIGRSGATVNILGATNYVQVTNLQVSDALITVNKGGGAGSASATGIELEENSLITGYVKTSGDRNSWALLAPNTAGIVTITPGAGGFTIDQGSHNPVTLGSVGATPAAEGASLSGQVLTLQPASASHPGVVTASSQTLAGVKTFDNHVDISSVNEFAHLRFVNGTAAPSTPTWEIGLRTGQSYFSVVKWDGTTRTTIFDVALNGILDISAITSSVNLRTTNLADISGGQVLTAGGANARIETLPVANEIQLLVTGNATQTGNIFEVRKTGGGVMLGVIDAGVSFPQQTASRVTYLDSNKRLVSSTVSDTTLGYLDATSSIQTQLNAKASTTLNNLGTTSINAALIPSAADTHNIGNSTTGFNILYTKTIRAGGASYSLNISGGAENQAMPSGTSVTGLISQLAAGRIGINTVGSSSGTATSDIQIETGNNSSSGNSGDIKLTTGTVGAGTRGSIVLTGKQVQMPDGTVSLPGITFASDPNSGIYSSAGDQISIATNAAEVLRINADKSIQIMAQIATPATPASGSIKIYAKSDDRLYQLNDAGLEQPLVGSAGDLAETSFTAADNQAVAANVTGLAFANATVRSFTAIVSIVRNATYQHLTVSGIQKAASWEISQISTGDDCGLTFSITSAGQVQYQSSSTGSTATVKFRAQTTSV